MALRSRIVAAVAVIWSCSGRTSAPESAFAAQLPAVIAGDAVGFAWPLNLRKQDCQTSPGLWWPFRTKERTHTLPTAILIGVP